MDQRAMRVKDIHDVLDKIKFKTKIDDYEAAHGLEDTLYENVLRAIAEGTHQEHPSSLAREALKSKQIEFERVCS